MFNGYYYTYDDTWSDPSKVTTIEEVFPKPNSIVATILVLIYDWKIINTVMIK